MPIPNMQAEAREVIRDVMARPNVRGPKPKPKPKAKKQKLGKAKR